MIAMDATISEPTPKRSSSLNARNNAVKTSAERKKKDNNDRSRPGNKSNGITSSNAQILSGSNTSVRRKRNDRDKNLGAQSPEAGRDRRWNVSTAAAGFRLRGRAAIPGRDRTI